MGKLARSSSTASGNAAMGAEAQLPSYRANICSISPHKVILFVFALLNPLFLPSGLFFTHIYAPISFYYLLKWNRRATWFISFLVTVFIIYTITISITGRDIHYSDYLLSTGILFSSLIFSIYVYLYIAQRISNLEKFIEKIIKFNFAFSIIALLLLVSGMGGVLWSTQDLEGKAIRLQLLFSEPSVYALVYVPFATYAITSYLVRQSKHRLHLLILSLIPLLLSGSAGVIGALCLAVLLANFRLALKIFFVKWQIILLILIVSLFALPNLIARYQSIIAGEDNSGAVRVVYSLTVAANMLEEKGMWLLGVGLGQLKFQVEEYTSEIPGFVGDRLPNSVASGVATIGILGVIFKMLVMFYLYFKTKTYDNEYSNTLFIFIVIYQFTGGYLTNINEYVALAFAFGYSRYWQRRSAELAMAT